MQMRPAIQIQSVVKALTDVVLPAVDPANKLAQEQARLAIGLLRLLSEQLPVQYDFDCDELARLLRTAATLKADARGGEATQAAVAALSVAATSGAGTLDAARSSPAAVEQAVRTLRAALGAVVTQVYRDGEPACRARVRDAVLAMSEEQLLRDRSLMLLQGWEPDPAAIPPIRTLLEQRRA